MDLNFPSLTTIADEAFYEAKLKTLIVPKLSVTGKYAFTLTTVSSYAIMKRELNNRTTSILIKYHLEDTTFHLTLATEQQLKTEYQSRGTCA